MKFKVGDRVYYEDGYLNKTFGTIEKIDSRWAKVCIWCYWEGEFSHDIGWMPGHRVKLLKKRKQIKLEFKV